MKRIFLAAFIAASFFSCQDDDDNNITIAQCQQPSELRTFDITHTSALLKWQNPNNSTNVTVEYGIAGFEVGTGTTIDISGDSAIIDNLNADTNYDFYVQAICSIDNISLVSNSNSFKTAINPSIPEFLPNLSELNLYSGNLGDLVPSSNAFVYDLSTKLFTDYAHKQRLIALPYGESLEYNGDGMPIFPDGTILAKTFYYLLDETNPEAGKKIIETRVLIRQNNEWFDGNYQWNEAQTDAVLDNSETIVPISWIDASGHTQSTDYVVPKQQDCRVCHQSNGDIIPIGPQLRSMNFDVNGVNQLQSFISAGRLSGAPSPASIGVLPDWEDESLSLETRTRAYLDMNCAHCHAPGGYHNINYYEALDLRYETSFDDSNIYDNRYNLQGRLSFYIPGYSMPYIGTTIYHQEGMDVVLAFLDTL